MTEWRRIDPDFHDNGVKRRRDGGGDGWADARRTALPSHYWCQDMDGFFGSMTFGQNTGDRVFLEYVPDHYQHHLSLMRHFGILALFDRKRTIGWARDEQNRVCTAYYLHMCRTTRRRATHRGPVLLGLRRPAPALDDV